jgi:carbamoyltransferase
VDANSNPRYYKLIKRFDEKTGCPLIINTSFNVRGEPIVCTPHEAYLCFMRTNMDVLVMDRFVMYKPDQKPLQEDFDWRTLFALD